MQAAEIVQEEMIVKIKSIGAYADHGHMIDDK